MYVRIYVCTYVGMYVRKDIEQIPHIRSLSMVEDTFLNWEGLGSSVFVPGSEESEASGPALSDFITNIREMSWEGLDEGICPELCRDPS